MFTLQNITNTRQNIIMKQQNIMRAVTTNSQVITLISLTPTILMPNIITPKPQRRMSSITADKIGWQRRKKARANSAGFSYSSVRSQNK
jgi:hypothetical protein